jgi:hypothetical protein
VSFTVSTRSPQGAGARAIHHVLLLLRFLTACEILLLVWYKWATFVSIPPWIESSVPGTTAAFFARSLPARYLMPGALLFLWILTQRGYTGASNLDLGEC